MPLIRKSIDVDASPENVFKYVTNPTTQPDWMHFVHEVDIISGDGQSKGTTDRAVVKLGPRTEVQEALWTEYGSPKTFARKNTSGMEMESRWTFEPLGNGTRVDWIIDYRPPMGVLGMMVDAVFMNRVFQNEVEESLEALKAQLEG